MSASPLPSNITIRVSTSAAEMERVVQWAADEGWNPGLEDHTVFSKITSTTDLYIAELGDEREPTRGGESTREDGEGSNDPLGSLAGAACIVNHCATVAFLGLFIVRPELRRRGIGRALWLRALAHARGRTVLLEGVAAQQANYAKSGFVSMGASRRLQGTISKLRARREAGNEVGAGAGGHGAATREIEKDGGDDLPVLTMLDRAASGYDRAAYVAAWTAPARTRRTVIAKAGDGFATIRQSQDAYRIGPIVASDDNLAVDLALAAAACFGAERVYIDVVPEAPTFAAYLQSAGFTVSFETARMYLGEQPTISASLKALANMELG
jgi:GNAT superfamily N-acetyltransferase